jgi:hypothetical protein
MLAHRDAIKSLFGGKLFDRIEGSVARRGKEWRNVVEHCIDVGLALETLGRVLGMTEAEREPMVNVGFVHDWNKRMTKQPDDFDDDEYEAAAAYAEDFLAKHDPEGHLLNATEPAGLDRLETPDATLAEHLVHLLDLSSMPTGLALPEERIADLRIRHKDNPGETDEFWKRKERLVREEERMVLGLLRAKGVEVRDGERLRDVINRNL